MKNPSTRALGRGARYPRYPVLVVYPTGNDLIYTGAESLEDAKEVVKDIKAENRVPLKALTLAGWKTKHPNCDPTNPAFWFDNRGWLELVALWNQQVGAEMRMNPASGSKISKSMQKRIAFFKENAPYATPPGRMGTAYALAKAEAQAENLEWTVDWQPDQDAERGEEAYVCTLRDKTGIARASLGGVDRPSKEYQRVVEAELAAEVLEEAFTRRNPARPTKTGTWLQSEEHAYPHGGQTRKGRAVFPDGQIRAVYAGIPDTYFTIPAHARVDGKYVKGYLTYEDENYQFHPSKK